jgi:DNA-directed RNA polymerase subunit RPC12/RpoP
VGEVKGKAPESTVQQYECGSCHTKFTLPREPGEDEKVICPKCQREWTGKEVMSA